MPADRGDYGSNKPRAIQMPEGMELDELALRELIAAEMGQVPRIG
jgi:hypothetical protein